MESKFLLNLPSHSLREDFPGKKNNWRVLDNKDLELIESYPGFEKELEDELNNLKTNNSISRTTCKNILGDVKNKRLRFKTYARFSKWCDWDQESSETIARNISRILFGFDMPRLWDQEDKIIDEKLIENFVQKINKGEILMEDKTKEETASEEKESLPSEEVAMRFEEYRKEGRIEFITFHPSYSYEEFIEGITAEVDEEKAKENQVRYVVKPGIFKEICRKALGSALGIDEELENMKWSEVFYEYERNKADIDEEELENMFEKAPKYVLIIDEINRGDIAKIFGELITLLEADKRLGQENELITQLPVSRDKFGIPPNLYIIATMNTADRSIALIDVALRRRFGFIEMNPDFNLIEEEVLNKKKGELEKNGVYELLAKSINAVKKINEIICKEATIGRDKQIGHSYFFNVTSPSELCLIWKHEILPLLQEYCYGDYNKINRILFRKDETKWIHPAHGIQELSRKYLDEFLEEILKSER
jgi:hypothetical protein